MTFRMQSWSSSRAEWTAMDEGPAKSVWKPRRTREEAVHKCIEWTGAILIPAMRVIDLDTGTVIWQDTSRYPEGGERIVPDWAAVLYEQVRAENRRRAEANRCECGMPWGSMACRDNHAGGIPPNRAAEQEAPADDGVLFFLAEESS
ncbi:hypothetical protein [Microbacterium sp. YY-01]|uniref:hypothetical protein n=1 Tax=Microbacterium sp. YY-01 TaxID=3421634 RepID=UPI003D18638F